MTDLNIETVGRFQWAGETYEIDHLGIMRDSQWGEFAVYCDGVQVAEFAIPQSALKPEFRPAALPVRPDQLIEMAKGAIAETAAES